MITGKPLIDALVKQSITEGHPTIPSTVHASDTLPANPIDREVVVQDKPDSVAVFVYSTDDKTRQMLCHLIGMVLSEHKPTTHDGGDGWAVLRVSKPQKKEKTNAAIDAKTSGRSSSGDDNRHGGNVSSR